MKDDRCGSKGCYRRKASDSEFCPVHKEKPFEAFVSDEEYPDFKYEITFSFSGSTTVGVEAQTEDEALDTAREVRDYRDAEITEPELHTDVRKKGKVEKSEKEKGMDLDEVKTLDKF